MRDDPGLDTGTIARCLKTHFALDATEISYLPIGHDVYAFVYRVSTADGRAFFLKIRRKPVNDVALEVPRALLDRGIANILAPLPTQSAELWCALAAGSTDTVVLYPYIEGENAMVAGMSDAQWQVFGAALCAVHSSGLDADFRDRLPSETFALPSATLVEQVSSIAASSSQRAPIAAQFAEIWQANQQKIDQTLARAEALGRCLRSKSFPHVLCHTDIHAANILVANTGEIYLVDWDEPMVAPRERDLFLVAGSRVARRVEPSEEDHFFAGYGPFEIDPDALIFYRYERIVQDLGEFGKSVLITPTMSDEARQSEADLAIGLLAPGGDIDRAEVLPRLGFPAE